MFLNFFRKDNSHYPDFWQQHLARSYKLAPKTAIKDIDFVIFDTETTGLDAHKDRIRSIGAIRLHQGELLINSAFEVYIQQEAFSKEAVLIHGLLKEGKEEKISEEQAIAAFVDFCDNAILVAHNAVFDVSIINTALKQLGCGKLKNNVVDTAHLAIRADGHSANGRLLDTSPYLLDALCDTYGIRKSQRHTAAGDAFITAVLLMKLLKKLEKRGVRTAADLLRKHNRLF